MADDAAPATGPSGLGDACRTAAGEVGGDGWGTPARGGISTEDSDITAALAALREAI